MLMTRNGMFLDSSKQVIENADDMIKKLRIRDFYDIQYIAGIVHK